MTVMKSALALFLIVSACGYTNAFATEKRANEVTGTRNRNTYTIAQSALEYNAEHTAVFSIHGAAASSGPCTFIDDHLSTSFLIGGTSIGCYISPGRQRFDGSKWKSRECHRASVGWTAVIDEQGLDAVRCKHGLANSQVQSVIHLAIPEQEPASIEGNRIALPSINGNVYRPNTGNRLLRVDNGQTFDYVSGGDESAFTINKKSSPVDQLKDELLFVVEPSAQDRHDGVLYSFNGQNESLSSATSSKSKKAKKKAGNKTDKKASDDSHSSGVLLIANDGKAVGCKTSHQSLSTISISCPEVDSVGTKQEVPQPTKRDQ